MFAYNPTESDKSGRISAEYQVATAETKANTMKQLGEDIGSAITSLAGMYAGHKMQQAGGKAFKQVMEVAGPSMGLKDEQLKLFKSMSDYDAFEAGQVMGGWAPAMISANSYANNFAPRAALANQQAANQAAARQPAANQQPIGNAAPSGFDARSWAERIKGGQ